MRSQTRKFSVVYGKTSTTYFVFRACTRHNKVKKDGRVQSLMLRQVEAFDGLNIANLHEANYSRIQLLTRRSDTAACYYNILYVRDNKEFSSAPSSIKTRLNNPYSYCSYIDV